MQLYLISGADALRTVDSNASGLSSAEAEKRLRERGLNKLAEPPKKSFVRRFLESLLDPMVLILLAAAAISAVVAAVEGESFTDVFIILFVVLMNSALSVLQESKAEAAISALQEMTAATAKVYRDGEIAVKPAAELVVGDVISLEAGDAVPADGRILRCSSLKAEESALTGESVPVEKIEEALDTKADSVPLGDRKNMVYQGSTIAYGRATALVTATGMDTEMGRIAGALSEAAEEKTPLQRRMSELSAILTKIVLGICVFMFVFGIIRAGSISGAVIVDTFMVAVALAVAAIPEGLTAVVTILLSMGMTSMSKRRALVRKLTAVETLGCTGVICSDKTGTLTKNVMTVVDTDTPDVPLLAKAMDLCSDAYLKEGEDKATGEPTEAALVNFALSLGIDDREIKRQFPRVGEAPFDSNRKMMSTVCREGESLTQYTKGAPEMLALVCSRMLTENGVVPMTEELRDGIAKANKAFADRALRVLGAAYKTYDAEPSDFSPEAIENDLIFIGMVGMIDPCREEVYPAIEQCRSAGIRPVMITGDHIDTAAAIAKDLGIIESAAEAITCAEIEKMSDEELYEAVERISVYARVQPEQKTRIVKAWKAHGMVTAMTGDGVNDAPSIKAADIGIGMGITGTDVTKNVADIVLADDNFATIVEAVKEGRRIYDNVKKAMLFLLSSNLSEVITVFVSSILGLTFLSPAHILWINLITDSAPALALGMEPAEGDVMQKKPRPADESIFAGGAMGTIAFNGLFIALISCISFFIGSFLEHGSLSLLPSDHGSSMVFLTMSMAEVFCAISMRSQKSSIFTLGTHNKWLWGASVLALGLTAFAIGVPFVAALFGFTKIGLTEVAIALGLAVTVIPATEIKKAVSRKLA